MPLPSSPWHSASRRIPVPSTRSGKQGKKGEIQAARPGCHHPNPSFFPVPGCPGASAGHPVPSVRARPGVPSLLRAGDTAGGQQVTSGPPLARQKGDTDPHWSSLVLTGPYWSLLSPPEQSWQ